MSCTYDDKRSIKSINYFVAVAMLGTTRFIGHHHIVETPVCNPFSLHPLQLHFIWTPYEFFFHQQFFSLAPWK